MSIMNKGVDTHSIINTNKDTIFDQPVGWNINRMFRRYDAAWILVLCENRFPHTWVYLMVILGLDTEQYDV